MAYLAIEVQDQFFEIPGRRQCVSSGKALLEAQSNELRYEWFKSCRSVGGLLFYFLFQLLLYVLCSTASEEWVIDGKVGSCKVD